MPKTASEAGLTRWADSHGRLIPPPGFQPQVVEANRSYHLVQPALDSGEAYTAVLARLMEYLPGLTFTSAEVFQNQSESLLEALRGDTRTRTLLRGVHLPVTFPQITVADYGTTLEDVFLPAVERSYKTEFKRRKFLNNRKGTLAGQVTVVPESRQDRLLAKLAEGPVTGIYFPTALHGFSIPAARKIMTMLPEGFILAGSMETAVALTGYPHTLARNYQTPDLDCAANVWQSPELSLLFETDDNRLGFSRRDLSASEAYSSGLLFLG